MPPPRPPSPPKTSTRQFRAWKGLNITDARVAIDDDEVAWLENAILIGKGAIQILHGPGPAVATLAQGIASLWGVTLNASPVLIAVGTDGSLTQVSPGGVSTVMAAAGTVTSEAHVTIWRGSPVLIVDPTTGFFSWDGSALATVDASQVGTAVAVFQGRVWIANGRTLTYTAPNTYNDFTAGAGAGSTIITDEAFGGNVVGLISALEQLWIVGEAAIEALANVTASGSPPSVTTSFSITNIVTNLGSNAQHSVLGYFRALAFLAPFGAYALSGVTPQKLSEKLDRLFPHLIITHDSAMAAVAVVENLLCLLFRVRYTGQSMQAGAGPRAMLLGFSAGKWFLAAQGNVTWITTLIVSGVSEAWATDGTTIFRLFGAADSAAVTYKIQSKLLDFGLSTTEHAVLKFGLELQASSIVTPALTVDSEVASEAVALAPATLLTIVNGAGAILTLVNTGAAVLSLITHGMLLSRTVATLYGHYLGWSITGTDPPYLIQAAQMEVADGRPWSTS